MMTIETHIPMLIATALAGLRVGAMVVCAPVLGHRAMPWKIRVLLAIALAVGLGGRLGAQAMPAGGSLVLAAGGEILIGATIGFAGRLLFEGVALGAFHVAQQMGLSLAGSYDPLSEQGQSAVGALMGVLAAVVFLLLGGHRALISAVADSYAALPLGLLEPAALMRTVTGVLTMSFVLALKLSAPALAAMLVVTALLGLLQRSVPQLHVFSIGLPVRSAVGALALAGSLAVAAPVIEQAVDAIASMFATVGGPA